MTGLDGVQKERSEHTTLPRIERLSTPILEHRDRVCAEVTTTAARVVGHSVGGWTRRFPLTPPNAEPVVGLCREGK